MIHRLPDDTNLYYEVHGKPEAPLWLVFLNGLSQSTLAWSAVAPGFAAEHRVLLLDLVFQGQSGAPEMHRSYDAHAADVEHLLQSLGAEHVVLCGLSYGSAVAQHVLVNHPGRYKGAVLLSTFAHNTPLFEAIGQSWAKALDIGGYPLMLEVMLPTVLGENYFLNPLIPIDSLKEARIGSAPVPSSLLKLMRATEERGDYRERLRAVNVPVLVAQGEHDLLIPPRVAKQVADHIPGARFEVVRGVGHTFNLEAIPQTIALLRKFIGQLNP